MTGDQQGDADLVEAGKEAHHLASQLGVEISRRFVGDQQGGPPDDGPGDTHPLLLTARERQRVSLFLVQEADLIQGGPHPACDLLGSQPGHHQGQGDIVKRAAVHQQAVILKNHAHLTAMVRDLPQG